MSSIESWLAHYGVLIVYLNVAADAAGLPLPSFPVLLISGALLAGGGPGAASIMLAALAGALTADLAWYSLGRAYGRRLLATLCRISLSPDSCVRETETIFLRYGPKSLLVSKFIPGFAVVAASMAGKMQIPLRRFLLIDACGILLWAGTWVGTGNLAGALVQDFIALLQDYGKRSLFVVFAALAVFVAWKWWQRHRAVADLAIPRLKIEDLATLIAEGRAPLVIDVRSADIQRIEGRIPGALSMAIDAPDDALSRIAPDAHVVVYCGCPNEVSAVHLVKRLRRLGLERAQPLAGGIDSWRSAGLPVEAAGLS